MIVTGGSRGIGAAIVRRAARDGYAICVNYRAATNDAEALVEDIVGGGGSAIAVKADMAREDDIVSMFAETDERLGRVDALVCNAGIDYTSRIEAIDRKALEHLFAVNTYAPVLCAREAISRMSTAKGGRGGVIVNVGSISARLGGLPEDVPYAASKGAVDSFTRGLATEVGPEGIRVVCVRPGLTRTEMFDDGFGLEQAQEVARATVSLGRMGEPEEIANMVVWMCSDEASYVSGFTYDVSGGR